jgi:hypothetical protein
MRRMTRLILVATALLLTAQSPSPVPSPRPTASKSGQSQHAQSPTLTNQKAATLSSSVVIVSPTPILEGKTDENVEHSEYEAAQYRLNRIQTVHLGFGRRRCELPAGRVTPMRLTVQRIGWISFSIRIWRCL